MELANVLPSMKIRVILMIHLSPICISHACKLYHGYHQRVPELRAAEFPFSTKLITFCWDLCSRQDSASPTSRLRATYISPGVLVPVTFLYLFPFVLSKSVFLSLSLWRENHHCFSFILPTHPPIFHSSAVYSHL